MKLNLIKILPLGLLTILITSCGGKQAANTDSTETPATTTGTLPASLVNTAKINKGIIISMGAGNFTGNQISGLISIASPTQQATGTQLSGEILIGPSY